MPTYRAVTKSEFANLNWKKFENYKFASADTVVPLVAQELASACINVPIAFLQQSSTFVPHALQGFKSGENLFVTPDGRWIGPYIPAIYRGHPFALAHLENNQLALSVDTDSGLIGKDFDQGFFDDSGEPSLVIKDIVNFLEQVYTNRQMTERMCSALNTEGIIVPWPLTVSGENGEQSLEGLYRIDEKRLASLNSDALFRIHQAGALSMAYCQLVSMQNIQILGKLGDAHAKAASQLAKAEPNELDLNFLNNDAAMNFDTH